MNNIKNRGTGAGGLNTNKNGLSYENNTDLKEYYETYKNDKNKKYFKIKFKNSDKIFIYAHKRALINYMKDNNEINTNIKLAHGCKIPDECYINNSEKTIFIIEKKFQQCSGSVCEKIQTAPFKVWHYKQLYPNYNIVYIYCLSPWFKLNCISELEYLQLNKIPVFWGNSETYKKDIINFITNYKLELPE